MPDYQRFRVPGRTYFFTVNLLERHIVELHETVRVTRQERSSQIDR